MKEHNTMFNSLNFAGGLSYEEKININLESHVRAIVSADTQTMGMDLGKWGAILPAPKRFNSFPRCEIPERF